MNSQFDRSYNYYAKRRATMLPFGIYEPAIRSFLKRNAGALFWLAFAIPAVGFLRENPTRLLYAGLLAAGIARVIHRWLNS